MKRNLRTPLLLVLALCMLLPFAACKEQPTPPATEETTQAGESSQETQETSTTEDTQETEAVTDAPAQGEIDYYPGMTYVKEEVKIAVDGFDSSLLGTVADAGQKGVATLLDANFDNGDKTADGKIAYRDQNLATIMDGQLHFIHDGKDYGKGWSTWSPIVPASVKENRQVQLSLDLKSFTPHADSTGTHTWISTFIGCYVSNYSGKIPDSPGDGLWFSFSGNDVITVIGGDAGGWPAGFASVKIPRGFPICSTWISCAPGITTPTFTASSTAASVSCCSKPA